MKNIFLISLIIILSLPLLAQSYDEAKKLHYYGEYKKSLKVLDTILEKNSDNTSANILYGLNLIKQYNYDEAEKYLKKGVKLAANKHDSYNLSWAYNNLGVIHKNKKNYKKALNYYQKALITDETFGFKNNIAREYNNMGNIYYNLMEYGKAKMFYRKSLWINQELNNIEGIAIAYNNLASFHYYEGNY